MNQPALPEIVIHHLAQARAVLKVAGQLGRSIQLRSAPDAAAYAGVGYLQALGEALGHELVIDCHDDAGLVMAALRTGCSKIIFSGSKDIHKRLVEMARHQQAWVRLETSLPALHLSLSPDDGAEHAHEWLLNLPD
ncbi:MAG: hypothetical protein ACR2QF_05005 [Geminicoccaceae bacterium]